MGNACATTEEAKPLSVSFRDRGPVKEHLNENDLPTQDIATKTTDMNLPSAKASPLYKSSGDYLLRSDPSTKNYITGGPYRYIRDNVTYKGQYKNGMRHGLGTQITPTGDVFTGNFAFD
jgi:MORN repeat